METFLAKDPVATAASMGVYLEFDNSALFIQGLLHHAQGLRVPTASLLWAVAV